MTDLTVQDRREAGLHQLATAGPHGLAGAAAALRALEDAGVDFHELIRVLAGLRTLAYISSSYHDMYEYGLPRPPQNAASAENVPASQPAPKALTLTERLEAAVGHDHRLALRWRGDELAVGNATTRTPLTALVAEKWGLTATGGFVRPAGTRWEVIRRLVELFPKASGEIDSRDL